MDLPKLDGSLIDNLFAIAEKIAPLIAGEAGEHFVDIGRTVVNLIDKARALVGSADGTQLEVKRDELDALIAKVNVHADVTLQKLKGE